MIREKDIKEGNEFISLCSKRVLEIKRIYRNKRCYYVILKDLSTNVEYEVPKEHLKDMKFICIEKEKEND